MMKYLISIAFVFSMLGSLNAQNTFHRTMKTYFRFGLELMDKEKYSAARDQFERYLLKGTDEVKRIYAEYYLAYCALNLENADGLNSLLPLLHNTQVMQKQLRPILI